MNNMTAIASLDKSQTEVKVLPNITEFGRIDLSPERILAELSQPQREALTAALRDLISAKGDDYKSLADEQIANLLFNLTGFTSNEDYDVELNKLRVSNLAGYLLAEILLAANYEEALEGVDRMLGISIPVALPGTRSVLPPADTMEPTTPPLAAAVVEPAVEAPTSPEALRSQIEAFCNQPPRPDFLRFQQLVLKTLREKSNESLVISGLTEVELHVLIAINPTLAKQNLMVKQAGGHYRLLIQVDERTNPLDYQPYSNPLVESAPEITDSRNFAEGIAAQVKAQADTTKRSRVRSLFEGAGKIALNLVPAIGFIQNMKAKMEQYGKYDHAWSITDASFDWSTASVLRRDLETGCLMVTKVDLSDEALAANPRLYFERQLALQEVGLSTDKIMTKALDAICQGKADTGQVARLLMRLVADDAAYAQLSEQYNLPTLAELFPNSETVGRVQRPVVDLKVLASLLGALQQIPPVNSSLVQLLSTNKPVEALNTLKLIEVTDELTTKFTNENKSREGFLGIDLNKTVNRTTMFQAGIAGARTMITAASMAGNPLATVADAPLGMIDSVIRLSRRHETNMNRERVVAGEALTAEREREMLAREGLSTGASMGLGALSYLVASALVAPNLENLVPGDAVGKLVNNTGMKWVFRGGMALVYGGLVYTAEQKAGTGDAFKKTTQRMMDFMAGQSLMSATDTLLAYTVNGGQKLSEIWGEEIKQNAPVADAPEEVKPEVELARQGVAEIPPKTHGPGFGLTVDEREAAGILPPKSDEVVQSPVMIDADKNVKAPFERQAAQGTDFAAEVSAVEEVVNEGSLGVRPVEFGQGELRNRQLEQIRYSLGDGTVVSHFEDVHTNNAGVLENFSYKGGNATAYMVYQNHPDSDGRMQLTGFRVVGADGREELLKPKGLRVDYFSDGRVKQVRDGAQVLWSNNQPVPGEAGVVDRAVIPSQPTTTVGYAGEDVSWQTPLASGQQQRIHVDNEDLNAWAAEAGKRAESNERGPIRDAIREVLQYLDPDQDGNLDTARVNAFRQNFQINGQITQENVVRVATALYSTRITNLPDESIADFDFDEYQAAMAARPDLFNYAGEAGRLAYRGSMDGIVTGMEEGVRPSEPLVSPAPETQVLPGVVQPRPGERFPSTGDILLDVSYRVDQAADIDSNDKYIVLTEAEGLVFKSYLAADNFVAHPLILELAENPDFKLRVEGEGLIYSLNGKVVFEPEDESALESFFAGVPTGGASADSEIFEVVINKQNNLDIFEASKDHPQVRFGMYDGTRNVFDIKGGDDAWVEIEGLTNGTSSLDLATSTLTLNPSISREAGNLFSSEGLQNIKSFSALYQAQTGNRLTVAISVDYSSQFSQLEQELNSLATVTYFTPTNSLDSLISEITSQDRAITISEGQQEIIIDMLRNGSYSNGAPLVTALINNPEVTLRLDDETTVGVDPKLGRLIVRPGTNDALTRVYENIGESAPALQGGGQTAPITIRVDADSDFDIFAAAGAYKEFEFMYHNNGEKVFTLQYETDKYTVFIEGSGYRLDLIDHNLFVPATQSPVVADVGSNLMQFAELYTEKHSGQKLSVVFDVQMLDQAISLEQSDAADILNTYAFYQPGRFLEVSDLGISGNTPGIVIWSQTNAQDLASAKERLDSDTIVYISTGGYNAKEPPFDPSKGANLAQTLRDAGITNPMKIRQANGDFIDWQPEEETPPTATPPATATSTNTSEPTITATDEPTTAPSATPTNTPAPTEESPTLEPTEVPTNTPAPTATATDDPVVISVRDKIANGTGAVTLTWPETTIVSTLHYTDNLSDDPIWQALASHPDVSLDMGDYLLAATHDGSIMLTPENQVGLDAILSGIRGGSRNVIINLNPSFEGDMPNPFEVLEGIDSDKVEVAYSKGEWGFRILSTDEKNRVVILDDIKLELRNRRWLHMTREDMNNIENIIDQLSKLGLVYNEGDPTHETLAIVFPEVDTPYANDLKVYLRTVQVYIEDESGQLTRLIPSTPTPTPPPTTTTAIAPTDEINMAANVQVESTPVPTVGRRGVLAGKIDAAGATVSLDDNLISLGNIQDIGVDVLGMIKSGTFLDSEIYSALKDNSEVSIGLDNFGTTLKVDEAGTVVISYTGDQLRLLAELGVNSVDQLSGVRLEEVSVLTPTLTPFPPTTTPTDISTATSTPIPPTFTPPPTDISTVTSTSTVTQTDTATATSTSSPTNTATLIPTSLPTQPPTSTPQPTETYTMGENQNLDRFIPTSATTTAPPPTNVQADVLGNDLAEWITEGGIVNEARQETARYTTEIFNYLFPEGQLDAEAQRSLNVRLGETENPPFTPERIVQLAYAMYLEQQTGNPVDIGDLSYETLSPTIISSAGRLNPESGAIEGEFKEAADELVAKLEAAQPEAFTPSVSTATTTPIPSDVPVGINTFPDKDVEPTATPPTTATANATVPTIIPLDATTPSPDVPALDQEYTPQEYRWNQLYWRSTPDHRLLLGNGELTDQPYWFNPEKQEYLANWGDNYYHLLPTGETRKVELADVESIKQQMEKGEMSFINKENELLVAAGATAAITAGVLGLAYLAYRVFDQESQSKFNQIFNQFSATGQLPDSDTVSFLNIVKTPPFTLKQELIPIAQANKYRNLFSRNMYPTSSSDETIEKFERTLLDKISSELGRDSIPDGADIQDLASLRIVPSTDNWINIRKDTDNYYVLIKPEEQVFMSDELVLAGIEAFAVDHQFRLISCEGNNINVTGPSNLSFSGVSGANWRYTDHTTLDIRCSAETRVTLGRIQLWGGDVSQVTYYPESPYAKVSFNNGSTRSFVVSQETGLWVEISQLTD